MARTMIVVRAVVPVPAALVALAALAAPALTVVVRAQEPTVLRAAMPPPLKPVLPKLVPMASLLPSVCARWPRPAPAPPKE